MTAGCKFFSGFLCVIISRMSYQENKPRSIEELLMMKKQEAQSKSGRSNQLKERQIIQGNKFQKLRLKEKKARGVQ